MTITNFSDLRKWFMNNNRGEKDSPYWTLYFVPAGSKETVVTFNDKVSDMEKSFDWLQDTIRMVNNPEGSRFRVMQVDTPRGNNPTGQVYAQIYERQPNPSGSMAPAQIGAIPSGYSESDVQRHVELALLKRENEDLKAAIGAPDNPWERIFGIVSESEPLSNALANLIYQFSNKITGTPMAPVPPVFMPSPVNGPATKPANAYSEPEEPMAEMSIDEMQQEIADNINRVCALLNVDALTLSRKLCQLVEANPNMAKTFLK